MGEAKRRKALGLMPTVHSFEAQMDLTGEVAVLTGPDDTELRELIRRTLAETQPTGVLWASSYRTSYVMAGRPDRLLNTAEDVQAIPVPPLRRFVGELALKATMPPEVTTATHIPVEGGVLHLRQQQHGSGDGRWESFPANTDPRRALEYLMQHPAARAQGKVVASFVIEQAPEGRTTIDPEPPAEWLEPLEALAREWHGETPEEWAENHAEALDEDTASLPLLRRTTFELRESAPMLSPFGIPFAQLGELEVHIDTLGSAYTLDGEEWLAYDPEGDAEQDRLPSELAGFLDVETVTVTVHADGRIDVPDGELPEGHGDRILTDLREATGAGDAAHWAEWTGEMLRDVFGTDFPDLAQVETFPVPQAVRLDLPVDALTDPDPLAQSFVESEVTFDGTVWHDLYAEELPAELQALRPLN